MHKILYHKHSSTQNETQGLGFEGFAFVMILIVFRVYLDPKQPTAVGLLMSSINKSLRETPVLLWSYVKV